MIQEQADREQTEAIELSLEAAKGRKHLEEINFPKRKDIKEKTRSIIDEVLEDPEALKKLNRASEKKRNAFLELVEFYIEMQELRSKSKKLDIDEDITDEVRELLEIHLPQFKQTIDDKIENLEQRIDTQKKILSWMGEDELTPKELKEKEACLVKIGLLQDEILKERDKKRAEIYKLIKSKAFQENKTNSTLVQVNNNTTEKKEESKLDSTIIKASDIKTPEDRKTAKQAQDIDDFLDQELKLAES